MDKQMVGAQCFINTISSFSVDVECIVSHMKYSFSG